ncbi:hypothetical protein TTHERM_00471540 (macronuclear) [Tetrahymena thermophila SB210]|uniref:Uncharacterized protein n=1 Tax=Tetrahymena thermophila (strain SB210) TaxID=312017 RepID=I7M029_TETTS|nr:hypothetical protein TTHERM_00471540 [Tetrahymena thermophila SB210]EAR85377.2 hypothetical protein TTHERM_00471540 [Tetrahymena thermophila SB210]|eukprot:XP_001033040.2 hypothetical protein TTHERM_00471540 [Tetrahymena thermophila SB210]
MVKLFFITKLLFKKQNVSRQALRWTPILLQHKLQNDSLQGYLFSLFGYPNYYKLNQQYRDKMLYQKFYRLPVQENNQGLQGLTNESLYTPQTGKQGDFEKIKTNQFVHAVQIVQNPMQMDDFSLNDVESVISDYEYDQEFNNSQFSESLVLSWNDSTAFGTGSSANSNSSSAQFAF